MGVYKVVEMVIDQMGREPVTKLVLTVQPTDLSHDQEDGVIEGVGKLRGEANVPGRPREMSLEYPGTTGALVKVAGQTGKATAPIEVGKAYGLAYNRPPVPVIASPQEAMDGSPAEVAVSGKDGKGYGYIRFQCGPEPEGINGTTIEEVIRVLVRRLEGFQAGPFKCRENALAITKLEEALHWLGHRTANRVARGVEGKNEA